ncbi:MAG TPA: SgcJ/EcaC family oxidoreductase [Candidatus Sulfotelmatobacter sp.]|nr:SgcJ/EcaC family oxidoreductase [Candidatus Sulfotelmatobacter sp.]
MNRFLVIALLSAYVSFSALGQSPATRIEDKAQDEAAIRKLMDDLTLAWNKHDVVSFSMVFAKDADFTNWRGTLRIHGREEIKNAHVDGFTGMFRQSTLTVTSAQIRFFAPGVAAVHCEWELVGTIDYDGKGTMPPRKYFPLMVVTKTDGKWLIAVYHNVLFQPLPPGAIIGPPEKK